MPINEQEKIHYLESKDRGSAESGQLLGGAGIGNGGTWVERRLGVRQPAVSPTLTRGAWIVEERRFSLRGKEQPIS
jgi:hypothetical protein